MYAARDQRNQGASIPSRTPSLDQEFITTLIIKKPAYHRVDPEF